MLSSCLRGLSSSRGLLLRANPVQRKLIHTAANGGTLRKTFEPDYLDVSEHNSREINGMETYKISSFQAYVSDIPLASEMKLNVQLCGYDFTLLESYQGFVHKLCENMGIDVSDR